MKLYELTGNLLAVWEKVNDEDADLDMLENTIQSIEGAIEVKVDGLARMIKMLDFDVDEIANEIKRLQDRKRVRENRISRIKQYMQEQMELAGKEKVSTSLLTISLQNNPPSVDDFAPNLIPVEYQKITYSIDRARLLADLKSGKEIPGCTLKQGKGLRIR